MADKILIDGKELLVLFEFEDDEYKKIAICLDDENKETYVADDKLISDKKIVDNIKKKYNLDVPQELRETIF